MIQNYLDSTYLKLPNQSGLSEFETNNKVIELTNEAIKNNFFSVMIRPNYVKQIKDHIKINNSNVKVGTVIGFHEGIYSLDEKINEIEKAIFDGADELDIVINYQKFLDNEIEYIENEIYTLTKINIDNGKTVKWIIETAALNDDQIAEISNLIKRIVLKNFKKNIDQIFVKSSTGFYETKDGKPNGATFENIKIMIEHSSPLPVKAAGGVKSKLDAEKMIELGVKRIGTSNALNLI